jgi:hypothetical protein
VADATTIKFLEGNAAIPTPDTTPERTAQFIKDELAKWAPVIRGQRTDRLATSARPHRLPAKLC